MKKYKTVSGNSAGKASNISTKMVGKLIVFPRPHREPGNQPRSQTLLFLKKACPMFFKMSGGSAHLHGNSRELCWKNKIGQEYWAGLYKLCYALAAYLAICLFIFKFLLWFLFLVAIFFFGCWLASRKNEIVPLSLRFVARDKTSFDVLLLFRVISVNSSSYRLWALADLFILFFLSFSRSLSFFFFFYVNSTLVDPEMTSDVGTELKFPN